MTAIKKTNLNILTQKIWAKDTEINVEVNSIVYRLNTSNCNTWDAVFTVIVLWSPCKKKKKEKTDMSLNDLYHLLSFLLLGDKKGITYVLQFLWIVV